MHELFFGELVMHDFMHNLFSKSVNPMIAHGDQPTYQTIHNAQANSIA